MGNMVGFAMLCLFWDLNGWFQRTRPWSLGSKKLDIDLEFIASLYLLLVMGILDQEPEEQYSLLKPNGKEESRK